MHWLYIAIYWMITAAAVVCAIAMMVHGYFMMRNQVPYVRMPRRALEQVAAELGVRPGDMVYDLGCGDGRVLSFLKRRQAEARYFGVENDWIVWLLAKVRARGVQVRLGEIAAMDLSKADRVFVYLGPGLMKVLEPRFEAELPAGARVVSVQFELPARTPDKVVELDGGADYAARMYVYNY